ncbi:MAG: sigma-70 family RNA polymerase sigma factor [Thermodesulfobacteriota bacterium]
MHLNATESRSNNAARQFQDDSPLFEHRGLADEELVRMFVEERDEGAFNEIANRYGEKVFRLALRITHSTHIADEVLQEVFLTLVEKLDSFREESTFSTWLYRVATNASLIQIRNRKRHGKSMSLEDYVPYNEKGMLSEILLKDWSYSPDEIFAGKEGMEVIERAIDQLPEKYRIVFHLRDIEGLSNEEVGDILGLSISAVKSRIHRARLFLRDSLSDYFYERIKKV